MPAPDFLDTNVLVYAYDSGNSRKQEIAQGLLRAAITGQFVISAQVLGEFATTLLHKISPALRPTDLLIVLDALAPIKVVPVDSGVIRRAVEVRAKYGLHFFDAMVIAAAEKAGCSRIWSEDLNSGQQYFGLTVKNPFS